MKPLDLECTKCKAPIGEYCTVEQRGLCTARVAQAAAVTSAATPRRKAFATPPKEPRELDSLGHAITRYIERWMPTASRERARAELMRMLPQATFVEHDGDKQIWRANPFGIADPVLLVVEDHIVRTVLKPGSTAPSRRPVK